MSVIKYLLSFVFLFFLFTNLFAQPTITQQPTNQLVSVGQSATFSLTATTPNPTSFQWYKNGVLIATATSTNYTTPPTILGDNGAVFYCIVSDSVGSVQSNNATLTVGESPTITQEPSSIVVTEGEGATFNISASGTATLLYQWKKNGVDIVGATTNVYNIVSTTLSDNGNVFTCSVTNDFGSDLSIGATLTVNAAAPVITVQPIDQDVYVGETATFSLEATSSVPMSFQWYANGTPVPGATSPSYTSDPIPNLTPDGTIVYCVVTNSGGSVQSNNAILNVSMPPGRVTDNLQVLYDFKEGEGTTITDVSGVGSPYNLTINTPSAVSWTENGLDIINSSNIRSDLAATKIINACKLTNELTIEMWLRPANVVQGEKTARILTLAGNSSQRNFVVAQPYTVYDVPIRTTETDLAGHPQVWAVDAVSTSLTHLIVTRSVSGTTTFYINGDIFTTTPTGGDFSNWDASYILGLANEINDASKSWIGSLYLVAIYNRALEPFEVSHNFNEGVPVNTGSPNLVMNPRYQGALTGESIEFRAGAVGKLPMTYQWQVDEGSGFTNIAGANKSFYRTPAVTTSDNKNDYRCTITNSLGSATSNFATLYVTPSNSKVSASKTG
jgi:beta-galactosidase